MYKPGNKVKLINSEHCTIGGWLHNTTAVIVDKLADGKYVVELEDKSIKISQQSAIDNNLQDYQHLVDYTNLIDLEKITIDRSFLERLLNCLCNQKYINGLTKEHQIKFQEAIDKTWSEGMDILHDSY